jgi:hypothetical protein
VRRVRDRQRVLQAFARDDPPYSLNVRDPFSLIGGRRLLLGDNAALRKWMLVVYGSVVRKREEVGCSCRGRAREIWAAR